ncbi:MAG: hypothetical protein RLZZ15_3106, partial [Verrucomicrobiota bacterium]
MHAQRFPPLAVLPSAVAVHFAVLAALLAALPARAEFRA